MQNPLRRETDEEDSTHAVWLNYAVAILATAGVFAVDLFTDKKLLDGALIGILISKVYDGLTKMNEYFFPTNRGGTKRDNEGKEKVNAE